MKKIYLLCLSVITCCIYVNAQNPNGWCNIPDPPVETKEFTIYGIADDANAPLIDGNIDAIWEEVTAHPLEEVVLDDDDEMTATVKWMYDDTYLYLLVEVMNDDAIATSTGDKGDHFALMYQKDFGGSDTGTVGGHDDDADWREWYWLRDGDRNTTFPSPEEIYKYHSPDFPEFDADIDCWNMETASVEDYSMQEEILLNQSLKINVDIDTNTDGTFNYTYEVALKWDSKWLNWDTLPTTDDTLGIDVSVRDADEEGGDKVGHINLNDYNNHAWCASTAAAMVHIGEKNISAGMQNNSVEPNLIIYPNPASDQLNINTTENIEQVTIMNIVGQQVKIYNNPNNAISVSGLNPGIYLVNIAINGQSITRKIIVK